MTTKTTSDLLAAMLWQARNTLADERRDYVRRLRNLADDLNRLADAMSRADDGVTECDPGESFYLPPSHGPLQTTGVGLDRDAALLGEATRRLCALERIAKSAPAEGGCDADEEV